MGSIAEQVAVPAKQRDVAWLTDALQTAIALEHSTLPLYLASLFSLRVQNYSAYNLIRSVAMEEMGHMASAANMLAAVGVKPAIAELRHGFPSAGLPGGAEPDLHGRLAPLSRSQLKNFMRLETPLCLLAPEYCTEEYPTIAKLYGAIEQAIDTNEAELKALIAKGGSSNQVGDDIGFTTITAQAQGDPLDQFRAGIRVILEQGEGSGRNYLYAGPDSEEEPSHYCKFAEIYYGREYCEAAGVELTRDTEPHFFQGDRLPFPDVVNTLAVPADGYAKVLAADPAGADVAKDLGAFDDDYTSLLADLDGAWNGPESQSWPTLGEGVMSMMKLRVLSCFNLMSHEVPPAVISQLQSLYPEEYQELAEYTDLSAPVFYGPRFVNTAAPAG